MHLLESIALERYGATKIKTISREAWPPSGVMQGKALYLQEDVEAVWSEATKIKDNLFREAASNVSSCSTWQQNVQTDPPVRRESVLAGKPVDHFFLRRSGGVSERGPQRARGWRVGVEKREPPAES